MRISNSIESFLRAHSERVEGKGERYVDVER